MSDTFEVIDCLDRDAWLKERRSGIGASEAAAVLGASPWKTAADVWAEKVGIAEARAAETEAMKWGLRLEPAIADAYMEETGRIVVRGDSPYRLLRAKKHPFLLATLDGEVVPIDERGPGVFECKTAALWKKDDWADEPPLQYSIQNQHQLVVTGYGWGADAVLIGGQRFLHTDFVGNAGFQSLLIQKLEAFWELVVKEQPPPLDGSESAKELLSRLFPRPEPGKVIELPQEAIMWDQELLDVKEVLKIHEDRKRELENQIKAALGDAEGGVLPDGTAYVWRLIQKKEYVVKATEYRELRRKALK